MKVLHLHPYLNIDCGITGIIYQITSDSINNNHFILTFGGNSIEKFKDKNLKVIRINEGNSSKVNIIRNIRFIKNFIELNEISIIHSYHRYFDLVSYIITKNTIIKTITSVQSIVRGWKFLSYKADILIAPSNAVKKHLITYFKKDVNKIKIIYNSIDLSEVRIEINKVQLKKELGVNDDIYIVGYIGRFDYEEKGVDILLKSFKKFNINHPNSKLILLGEGKNAKLMKKFIVDNNLPAKVLNPVENIYDYLNIFDILVIPSRIDPFPLAMLAGGAAGIPIIGSATDGIKEFIINGVNGLLFETNNVDDLLAQIKRFYTDRKIADYCKNNIRNDVSKNYSSDKYIKELNEIYN
jgi:glycosyltransferase involved in cell wall biosynthesis